MRFAKSLQQSDMASKKIVIWRSKYIMNNNGNNMHFIRYLHRVADNGAEEYLAKKEKKKRQMEHLAEYEKSNEYDKCCSLSTLQSQRIEHVNYDSGDSSDCGMYYYKVKNAKKKSIEKLIIWVGYDKGGIDEYTGEVLERGYYLYYTNDFSRKKTSRKIMILESGRRSERGLERAIDFAKKYSQGIISFYSPNLDINWNKPIYEKWAGEKICFSETNLYNLRMFRTISKCDLQG